MHPSIEYGPIIASGKPSCSLVGANIKFLLPIFGDDNEELYYKFSVPCDWDRKYGILTRFCVATNDSETIGKAFNLRLSYCSLSSGTNISDYVFDIVGQYTVATSNASRLYFASFSLSTNYMSGGDEVSMRFRRIGAIEATDISSDLAVFYCHAYYCSNCLGCEYQNIDL